MFEQVQEVLIDDFVHNGADQLLLLFEQKRDTEDLGHFILTDCEGLHLDSRKTSVSLNFISKSLQHLIEIKAEQFLTLKVKNKS